jgi:iron complex transport system ATP-binding protein
MVVELSDLSYSADNKLIVKDVNLCVKQHEFVAIMGANGAGKTTLLKLICGILPPANGTVKVFGKDLRRCNRKEIAKIMGYVSQSGHVYFNLTVEEFILLGRFVYMDMFGQASKRDHERVNEVMESTGLIGLRSRGLASLSGGEYKRVLIAAAIAQGTAIIVLDEPMGNLDPKSAADVLELLKTVHSGGKTIMMVSHDINQALMLADSIVGLKGGEVLFYGKPPKEVVENYLFDDLYDMRFQRLSGDSLWLLPVKRL